jgi:hypothetical protein
VAILTIAGMNLVAVSVAGGLVGLQRHYCPKFTIARPF